MKWELELGMYFLDIELYFGLLYSLLLAFTVFYSYKFVSFRSCSISR
jgi:hypothetical protein